MKEFVSLPAFIRTFNNGKLDFQDNKTSDFSIVAENETGELFVQSFKSVNAIKNPIKGTFIKLGKYVFLEKERIFL